MHFQSAERLAAFARPLAVLAVAATAALTFAPAAAQQVAVQQFGVTAVNNTGNALYNVALTPNAPPNLGALITGTQALNTDGAAHKNFFAVVRVPNSVTSALDLIVADATNGQIVRYPGPGPGSYATSTPIFTWSGPGSGPKYPISLAVDVSGNLFAISAGVLFDTRPALWVLPFNPTTGNYGAPVLIDNTFGLVSEVLVATSAATAVGTAPPAWNAGDVLVMLNNLLSPHVVVYSQAAIQGVLANPGVPLSGPTSTAVATALLRGTLPIGMDIWPADASHGVSLLITTIGGRVMRFDSASNALTTDFASGLGLGLERIKVGTFSTLPYAFVAQYTGTGRILQLGAPPPSGANTPLATLSVGARDPQGLAVTSSGSVPVSTCIAPSVCAPLGPQLTTQISGPGTANLPPAAPVLEESCVVNADPRVTVSGTNWSCAGGTLDVANYCPGFPSTVLPGSLRGHSGPTGSGFVVVKATAKTVDQSVNNTFIQDTVDPNVPLPGSLNLNCPQLQMFAWAPRADLPSIEGTIVEGGPAPGSNYFIDLTGFCDKGGGTTHSVSMYAYGLGLNSAPSGLANGLPAFVTDKFTNLQSTITVAAPQINPAVAAVVSGYVTQAQGFFNNGIAQPASNGFSCAMNSLASADSYVRANLQSFAGAAPPGNINPAGEIDGRLGNLFLAVDAYFLGQPPNATWPTNDVPPCVTLTATPATVITSAATPGTVTLTWAPAAPTYPLLFAPVQCTLTASDGTFLTPATEAGSGSAPSGPLVALGTYSAQISCAATVGNSITSFTQATANVIALASISVTPLTSQVAAGGTTQLTATGTFSSGQTQVITGSATWTSGAPAVATVSASGLVTCSASATASGQATISAASAGITGSASVSCLVPVVTYVVVTPSKPAKIPVSGTLQLTATATFQSGMTQNVTNSASWASSAPSIATVSATGLVKCAPPHYSTDATATISATFGNTTGKTVVTCSCGKSPPYY